MRKILAERHPEQVPLFTHSEDHANNASGGVIVNAAPAPKAEAHIDNAPYAAARNSPHPSEIGEHETRLA